MRKIVIERATVKAKVVNVTGGEYPTLLVLVKEFTYKDLWQNKVENVEFEDFSHKVAFTVHDADDFVENCFAQWEVGRLVKGDIVEFSVCYKSPDDYYFSSFKILETEQECLDGLTGLASLAMDFNKEN